MGPNSRDCGKCVFNFGYQVKEIFRHHITEHDQCLICFNIPHNDCLIPRIASIMPDDSPQCWMGTYDPAKPVVRKGIIAEARRREGLFE